ncbi:MAG TPA: HipA domain-containing protein, partial [Myxococcales bacterium]|nr:HipA domain-containing protein [Myxococcales bacterium]
SGMTSPQRLQAVAHAPIYRIDEDGQPRRHGEATFLASGGTQIVDEQGHIELFAGLPPWANDMIPDGFLGRRFAARYPELGLPPELSDWSDDHRVVALTHRGEDCIGNLILGSESLARWQGSSPTPINRHDYPALVRQPEVNSLVGGEHPKFLACVESAHVLVKFVPIGLTESMARWRDLLACERLALDVVRRAGIDAAEADVIDMGDQRFLEVRRFDRVGVRGRRGVISLGAISLELYGDLDSWTLAAVRLERDRRLSHEDARRVRWLDAFGQLIANTDRHFWNVSFFTGGTAGTGPLRLAPAYDMVPMLFAPNDAGIPNRTFEPNPPNSNTLDVWRDAAELAEFFWDAASRDRLVSAGFREIAADCRRSVAAARQRFGDVV